MDHVSRRRTRTALRALETHTTRLLLSLALLATSAAPSSAALPAPDPDDGGIELPAGFRALVVADDLGPLRFMAVAPNGDLYVKMNKAGIVALRDTNGDGRADLKETFGSGGGTGIAVRDGWLYHSTNTDVYRYKLTPGELVPKGQPETIVASLPAGKEHYAKSFAFDPAGRLYVEVGSPSNAHGDPDRARGAKGKDPTEFLKKHGGFWRFDPAKPNQVQANGVHVSTGHRHVMALAWNAVSKAFFFVMNGRDLLGTVDPEHYDDDDNAELPAEEMHVLREGANYGWPFTYYDPIQKARMLSPEFGGDKMKRAEAGKYPDPLVAFPAHWAPMQMAFYSGGQFPASYRGGAFVAFHGSWNRAPRPQKGYNVAFVPFDDKGMPRGRYEVFADGFPGKDEIASPRDARYRPCGLAVGPDGSLYVADSEKGRVWRIVHAGATPTAESAIASRTASEHVGDDGRGAALYREACATCHMADGGGVPGMQPSLLDSAVVSGDADTLIDVLLRSPARALPAADRGNSSSMPEFSALEDAELAALLSHVRQRFGNGATPITAAQVGAVREKSHTAGR
jgi:glucose/arabinose dehydrogenase